MLGLAVTGGTRSRVKTPHSVLTFFGFMPNNLRSSSLTLTSFALISVGKILFFPTMKLVGFSNFTFSCVALQ